MEKEIKLKTIDESIRLLRLRYDGFNELYLKAQDNLTAREYLHKQEGILAAIDSLNGLRTSVVSDLF